MIRFLFSIFLLAPFAAICQGEYHYHKPIEQAGGWSVKSLSEVQFDSTRFYQLFNQLQGEEHKIQSMLIVYQNQLILEEYFAPSAINKTHDLRSVNKSINSILLGIAIDKGFIQSVKDPVNRYVKNPSPTKNLDPRKDSISLEHLITMSSGLECNDWNKKSKGQEDRLYKKKDILQEFVNLPQENDPGSVSHYCTVGQLLVKQAIENASQMSIIEFAQRFLFDPLEIKIVTWGHTSKKSMISAVNRMYMTPRDLAKIGQLVLQEGEWNGRQVVSKEWIEESTRKHTQITQIDYGYLWWNLKFARDGKPVHCIAATGNGGQYILIFPEIEMIAVFTGDAYNAAEDKIPFSIVRDIILPSMPKAEY